MSEKPKTMIERGLKFWFTDQDAIHVRAFEVVITFCMIYYFSFQAINSSSRRAVISIRGMNVRIQIQAKKAEDDILQL